MILAMTHSDAQEGQLGTYVGMAFLCQYYQHPFRRILVGHVGAAPPCWKDVAVPRMLLNVCRREDRETGWLFLKHTLTRFFLLADPRQY